MKLREMRAGVLDVTVRLARTGDGPGIARTHVAGWRMAYRGIVASATLDPLPLDRWIEMWRERLAVDG